MRRFVLPLWAMALAACQPIVDPNCRPTASEKRDWDQAQRESTAEAYRTFLTRHPESCYAPVASWKLRYPVALGGVAAIGASGAPGAAGKSATPRSSDHGSDRSSDRGGRDAY